jgi:hypothetical protein
MQLFDAWVASAEQFAAGLGPKARVSDAAVAARLHDYLDGGAGRAARELIPVVSRRAVGAFFTDQAVAETALGRDWSSVSPESVFLDPACGAGDLLLAVGKRLPVQRSLAATVEQWGKQLRGIDPHAEFVRAAKVRLALLAVSRFGAEAELVGKLAQRSFPGITVGDGLGPHTAYETATHIFLNPPFGKTFAPDSYQWGTGKVSQAGVFLDHVLTRAREGARIITILPDVLRTGTNYGRWRSAVERRGSIEEVKILGRFDRWADVDVFVLRMVKEVAPDDRRVTWWTDTPGERLKRIGEEFSVSVGSVVPHRDEERGEPSPYVFPGVLPAWSTFDACTAPRRRFQSRLFVPPFVAVRRTSAPGDARARATVVIGTDGVLVENHLLVLTPVSGRLSDCQRVMEFLRTQEVNDSLDQRIRCRHLTVAALRGLSGPIIDG